ncbi:hypothetical protein GX586_09015 [bacterium]|nr:hypothetical protein [bacterium]
MTLRRVHIAPLAPLTALLLCGCTAMMYIPLLLVAPLMPVIQLAVKIAARYGPLLLMLAEADPSGGAPARNIALEPAGVHRIEHRQLADLETQLGMELAGNTSLRSVAILEASRLDPVELERWAGDAATNGLRLRLVFVDSRRFAAGDRLLPGTRALLENAGVPIMVTPGLAEKIVGDTIAVQVAHGAR